MRSSQSRSMASVGESVAQKPGSPGAAAALTGLAARQSGSYRPSLSGAGVVGRAELPAGEPAAALPCRQQSFEAAAARGGSSSASASSSVAAPASSLPGRERPSRVITAVAGSSGAAQPGGRARPTLQERFGKMLGVSTGGGAAGRSRASGAASPPGDPAAVMPPQQHIRPVEAFTELFELGREVMPSTHAYMKVHFCIRRRDGAEFVVKIRQKPHCFRGREDERNWRRSTEFLLNTPVHSGLCKIHEVLEDVEGFYIVMEKVNGLDLFETLDREGNVTTDVAKDILRQLLAATAHLHAQGAVHKDLKLENIMVEASPKRGPQRVSSSVKLIDFDTLEEWTPSSPKAKDVVGTDQYISPESYDGRYTPMSDVFAIGVIAFKLITGRFPFHDDMFDDEAGENWVGSPKMKQIRGRLKGATVDFRHAIFRQDVRAKDFISKMLAYDEFQRPTAQQALDHPFLQQDLTPAVGMHASRVRSPQSPQCPGSPLSPARPR